MDTLRQRIAQEMKLAPEKLRRDQLNIISRMAMEHANRETEKELMRMRLAKSPEEAELMLTRIASEQELAKQRRANAAFDEARTGEIGKPKPEDVNARMRNAAALLGNITRTENDLRKRYTKLDMRVGSPTVNQEVVDVAAMQKDPQYVRLQELQDHYDELVSAGGSGAHETGPSSLRFDPERIRRRVLEMMKNGQGSAARGSGVGSL